MGQNKDTLDFTLLDYYDTTREKLILAQHVPGPKSVSYTHLTLPTKRIV